MNKQKRHSRFPVVWRLAMVAFMAFIPVLAVGGSAVGTAQASAPMPAGAISDAQAVEQYSTLVMRVYFTSRAQRDQLAAEFSAEEIPTTKGYLTIFGDSSQYKTLVQRGLRVEIDVEGSQELSDPQLFRDTFYGGYKTVEEIYAFLDQKVAQYPTLAEKQDIGDTWCKTHPGQCTYPTPNNGYDLFVLRITNQNIPGPKPVFWADGGIHSREIATPEVAMRYISWLLDNYDTNADARWMVDYNDIYIMPTYNPDGHHIVEAGGGGGSPYMYRKNGNNSAGNCSIPPTSGNHFGIDDNRNFPFKWGCCGGSTNLPCDQTYRGVSPGSEDETQAVTTKLRSLYPDQRGPNDTDPAPITTTGVYQNIHTVVPVNLYSWGWTYTDMPNFNETDNIAKHISSPQAQGNGYDYGSIPNMLYVVDGGSIDFTYGEMGVASFSTELSGNSFLPSFTCIDNPGCGSTQGIWPENKGMLTYLTKIARTPYLTSHGPDANTIASTPMTVTQGTPSQLTGSINFAWNGSDGAPNRFLQNVGAAEYYIDTPPWAGGTPIAMTATDGNFNSPTEAVQAAVSTGSLSVGRHILMVRGRGVNDFSVYQTWGPFSATFLDVTPSGGPTNTPLPATSTATAAPATGTPVPPTSTSVSATDTATAVPATSTAVPGSPTATPTACTISFTDVPEGSTFYPFIQCLACRGIVNGYPDDNTFRPGNNVTRGQLAKIVSNSAGFTDPAGAQMFEDVLPGSTFYDFIQRLAMRNYITGYPCGSPGEPCGSGNLPYFRPGASATRGQIAKIVSNAAGFVEPAGTQLFEDVAPGSTFYDFIQRLATRNVITGYPCGSPGEPCGSGNLPYFRPNSNATRGQTSKIVSNTFFPACSPAASK
ncbi:MAG: M14 family zinc carboxypeptidase [Chloroflexota bacterium]